MATLTYSFPNGVFPSEYTPPIPEFTDFFPGWPALVSFDGATVLASTSKQQVLQMENGLRLVISGTGFTYDSNMQATGGTVTSIAIRLNDGTSVLQTITGISEAFTAIYAFINSQDQYGLYQHLFSGNDVLNGNAPEDDLDGGAGDDILNAGNNGAYMRGGEGNDVLNGSTSSTATDQAAFDDSYFDPSATLGVVINTVAGTARDSYGDTDTINNIDFFRGSRFADTFTGSSANETFAGLGGRDTFNGGGGSDTVRYDLDARYDWAGFHGTGGAYVDLAAGFGVDGFGQRDRLISIENVRGSINDDTMFGSSAVNRLRGFDGQDFLYGRDGADRLEGGNDDDVLVGGTGGDILSGDGGSDTASYEDAASGVMASLANAAINTGDAAGDTYGSIENLLGSAFNDGLNGSNGVANFLSGGAGNDILKGYTGNDTLEGGEGNDTFSFNTALNATTNVDTILDFSTTDDIIQLENAFFTALTAMGTLAASAFKNMAAAAKDADDRIIYNAATGILYYDADGSGTAFGNVKFATLIDKPTLSASDFVVV